MRTICLIPILLVAMIQTSFGQGVPVVLGQKKGGSIETLLLGRTDTALRLQVKDAPAGNEYVLALDQIDQIRFVIPETVNQAQDALNQGQWERAATILKPIIDPMLPYLDLPNSNAVPLVMLLAETLRRAGKFEDALAYFEKMRFLPPPADSVRASVWAAYCHAALGRSDAAWKILQATDPPKRDSEHFALYQFVSAQVRFSAKDYLAALDEVSQLLAVARLESDLYSDSLFLAAQCYEWLGNTNEVTTRIVQLTKPGTNRAAVVKANVIVYRSLTGNTNYVNVAKTIYQEIVSKYPTTSVALKSQLKLPSTNATPAKAATTNAATTNATTTNATTTNATTTNATTTNAATTNATTTNAATTNATTTNATTTNAATTNKTETVKTN